MRGQSRSCPIRRAGERASLPGMRSLRESWSDWGLGLAALAVALDQHELAARLLGATEAVSKTNYRLRPIERKDYNRLVDAARARLGAARFEAVWIQGPAQGFEQVTEEAVSILEAMLHDQDQATTAPQNLDATKVARVD